MPLGLEDDLLEAAEKAFASTSKPRRKDGAALAETLRTGVRRAADNLWGKKPIVKVSVVQL